MGPVAGLTVPLATRLWMARLAGLYQSEISLLFDGLQTTSLVDL
uniref:Uncharacterized protein n=1 Tax=Picea glauca TaxID=3330 RepID=A0A101LTT5_PICGL|nr:hypothetical protein ABT39_MTgene3545 [Picea glauca]